MLCYGTFRSFGCNLGFHFQSLSEADIAWMVRLVGLGAYLLDILLPVNSTFAIPRAESPMVSSE